MDGMEERLRQLFKNNKEAATNLVFAQLDIGLTFCSLIKKFPTSREKFVRGINRARNSLALAEKYMWRLKMEHPQFDQMMAQVERLKFELDALEKPD